MSREPLTLLIADDEPFARNLLRRYIDDTSGLRLVHECASGDEVAAALGGERPDVALLDIRMPGSDIFDVLAAASQRSPLPSVVFATAYDAYAVRAFELNAIDYLVKPYSPERFGEAIRRVRERAAGRGTGDGLAHAINDLGRRPERLLVPDGRRLVPVQVADITWIKAEGDYARVFAGGRSYLVSRTLKDLETRLDPAAFLRIHRSAIVQTVHMCEVRADGNSRYRIRLSDGNQVIVSRTRAPELKRYML